MHKYYIVIENRFIKEYFSCVKKSTKRKSDENKEIGNVYKKKIQYWEFHCFFLQVIRQPFITDRLVIKVKDNTLYSVYLNEFNVAVAAFSLQCTEAKVIQIPLGMIIVYIFFLFYWFSIIYAYKHTHTLA